MNEQPKRSHLKFWLIFGAINLAIYIAGYLVLTKAICTPPMDDARPCQKLIDMWPLVLVVPALVVVVGKFKAAGREIGEYHAQKNKWTYRSRR